MINSHAPIERELKFLFKLNKQLVIFDIGACEGESSIQYSRLFPYSKVYSFEPVPTNVKMISDNFLRYNIKNASFYNIALSSENGHQELYLSEGRPDNIEAGDWDFGNKSSSLLEPGRPIESIGFLKFSKSIFVKTKTLESFCEDNEIGIIDFIHMDVQGAELLVLEGAGKMIENIKAIYLEVSRLEYYKGQPLEKDVKTFMQERNFVLVKDFYNPEQGDQLYISRKYFTSAKILSLKTMTLLKEYLITILIRLDKLRLWVI